MAAARAPIWQRAVGDFPTLLHLAPPTVHPDDPLESVVATLAHNPTARNVFVVDENDRFLGIIPERRLDSDLVKLILPQQLWASFGDFDPRELLLVAKGRAQTARDLMVPSAAFSTDTALKAVLIDMVRDGDPVRALVDEQHRFLGYLGLFEILAELLHQSGA